jgi:hypothetical protein
LRGVREGVEMTGGEMGIEEEEMREVKFTTWDKRGLW